MRYAAGDCVDERFLIRALLGEGGMAEVYRATDQQTGKEVVLKVPRTAIAGDLPLYNRYRREMEIALGLDHPGLQRLLSEPNAPYMLLEYVEGQSLRTYLSREGPLPVQDVICIGIQLADALEYVHQRGIVHRDLKPENILIGPDRHVTLTDFGIALKLASRRLTFSHLSNVVGTPDYMAPEQVRGERGDARTDVYALGCVLYELLTGRVPYPADEPLVAMQRKVLTDPPLVRKLRDGTPQPLEAIIYRALRRRPEERYPTMAALAHDLGHLDEVQIPAHYERDEPPPTPPGDLPPWRTTIKVMAAVFAILFLLGFLAQLLHQGLPPR